MTASQLPVALAALVTIVADGATLSSTPPAHLTAGRVMAPAALFAQLADRVVVHPDGRALEVRRGERACVAPLAAGTAAVAPLARCLGAAVGWDARAKTLALTFAGPRALRTHAPFDATAPQVQRTTIFTPEPPTPTPRAVATGVPRPRRTAIPATPSFPLPATSSRPQAL